MNRYSLPLAAAIVLFAAVMPAQGGGNPLTRQGPAAADPFARTFGNDTLTLVLQKGEPGYSGQLDVGGASYPVTAEATADGGLSGSFQVDADAFAFTATLAGDVLTLVSDGASHELRATSPVASDAGHAPPPPLAGVYDGRVASYRHPEGYFSLDLPVGWTQANITEAGVLFNPGLKPTDTLDCILVVTFGELEESERGVAITDLLDRQEAQLRQQMGEQQVALQPAKGKSGKVLVGELPGAEQTWQGVAGGHPVIMWVGATTVREYYIAIVAVIVEGQEQRFLPGVKRMFRSVQPKPPQRDRKAETGLAGGEFSHSSMFSGGSMVTTYSFRGDGTCNRRTMMSGSVGFGSEVSADSGDNGRYEVVGPLVYLRFKDGQVVARIEGDGAAVSSIRIGRSRYTRG